MCESDLHTYASMQKKQVIEIKYTVKEGARLPFVEMAAAALPRGYQLSLVMCGDKLAQRMNKEYRLPALPRKAQAGKKTYLPNVLSFPLSKTEGEIFLNIRKAAREARLEGVSKNSRIALLFVHGCFHLAGYKHSDKMDALELKVLKKFDF